MVGRIKGENTMRFAIYEKHTIKVVTYFEAEDRDEALQYFADYVAEDPEARQDLDYAYMPERSAQEMIDDIYKMAGTLD